MFTVSQQSKKLSAGAVALAGVLMLMAPGAATAAAAKEPTPPSITSASPAGLSRVVPTARKSTRGPLARSSARSGQFWTDGWNQCGYNNHMFTAVLPNVRSYDSRTRTVYLRPSVQSYSAVTKRWSVNRGPRFGPYHAGPNGVQEYYAAEQGFGNVVRFERPRWDTGFNFGYDQYARGYVEMWIWTGSRWATEWHYLSPRGLTAAGAPNWCFYD